MTLAAVVFDLDETLAVTRRDRDALLAETASATGFDPIKHGTYEQAHREAVTGETRTPIFETLLDDESVDPADVARTYRTVVNDHLSPVDGVENLLDRLGNGDGYRLGLLTDGPGRAQRSKLEKLGWEDRFAATVVTGTMETRKPDPNTFQAVLEDLSVELAEAVYVGDKPAVDIEGALDVGMYAVQVLYPDGPDPNPRADAHVERERLSDDLPAVLEELSAQTPPTPPS